MKLSKIVIIVLAMIITLTTTVSAQDIFTVKTALNATDTRRTCGVSVLSGDTLEFSAEDLERRLGLKPQSLNGITVTSLPKPEQGALFLDGVSVGPFEFISRDEVGKLCFVPNEEAVSASLTFIPRAAGSTTTELAISILQTENTAPELQPDSYDTVKNVTVSGYITALDADGDEMRIQVASRPKNGVVQFDGMSFTYTPYKDVVGKDSFTIYAVDAMNNFSGETPVSINIDKIKDSFYYADMASDPSAYAAVKLRENGVISGIQIGGKQFFHPDEATSRGEFLIMAIAASGLEPEIKPTVNTGLPNDASIPAYLKPYVKKAVDEKIWSVKQSFHHKEIPTRAEAVVLTARLSKISDVKDFSLQMSDKSDIPGWATKSYKDLAAYRMLDLHDNMARPSEALTNSYSADLLWQLWKHCHRAA